MEKKILFHREVANMRKSLFDQGFLDEQYIQLEELQDEVNPNFVEEVAILFFKDSARLAVSIDVTLQKRPLDFNKLETCMHNFKGSSSSVGGFRLKNVCSQFQDFCLEGNTDGCLRTFELVKKEHATLKKKLDTYFQMVRQLESFEIANRPKTS